MTQKSKKKKNKTKLTRVLNTQGGVVIAAIWPNNAYEPARFVMSIGKEGFERTYVFEEKYVVDSAMQNPLLQVRVGQGWDTNARSFHGSVSVVE